MDKIAATPGIFQSTLPAKGATSREPGLALVLRISIHAPSKGSDNLSSQVVPSTCAFQSTLPAKGATGRRRFSTLA